MASNQRDIGKEEIEMDNLNKKRGSVGNETLNISNEKEDEDEEFKSLKRKYYQVSKEIRMDALQQEKKELEKTEKSPPQKYYEGSKTDRIKLLDEIKEQMEELEKISKGKKK